MLTKGQIAQEIADDTGLGKNLVMNVLSSLAAVASDEVGAGNDFTVPGVARISWAYRVAKKKGERWKKGESVQGFGGVTEVKTEDSPPIAAKARLTARPTGGVSHHKPKSDPQAQKDFLKSSAGKAVASRKK
jgi:nucleoid DNA-binding protein